jgi:hypothetical protein
MEFQTGAETMGIQLHIQDHEIFSAWVFMCLHLQAEIPDGNNGSSILLLI